MPQTKPLISAYGLWLDLHGFFEARLKGRRLDIITDPLSEKNCNPATVIAAVFIDSPLTKKMMDKLPRLKLIAAMSTGFDHIDLPAAKKRGITVCNIPTYGENTVAEHTFALMLGLTRKLFASVKRVKEGRYDFGGLRGVDLKGRTLGVIGTGHIGAHVIRIARGFEMNVIATDTFPNKKLSQEFGFSYVPLARLLKRADIITLHTPLLPSTRHLINQKNIRTVKPDAYLINTARGGLVESEALVWALQSGRLAGVGLDVMEDENLIQNFEAVMHCSDCQVRTSLMNSVIIDHPNAIVTPHNAFNSTEALQRILAATAENIQQFFKGKPVNVVK